MNIYKELAKVFDAVAMVRGKKQNIQWLTSESGKKYAINENGERVAGDPRATGGAKKIVNKNRSQEKIDKTFKQEGQSYKNDEGQTVSSESQRYGKDKIVKKSEQEAYQNMDPKLKDVYSKAVENEEKNTKVLEDISKKLGMKLVGTNASLKQPKSFLRKVDTDYSKSNGGATKEEIANSLSDLNRYTMTAGPNDLVDKANKTLKYLKKLGFKIQKVKNYWDVPDNDEYYNGFNCQLVNPNGQKIELQFHTLQSFVTKEFKTHKHYEDERDETKTKEERLAAKLAGQKLVETAKQSGKLNIPKNYKEFAKNL